MPAVTVGDCRAAKVQLLADDWLMRPLIAAVCPSNEAGLMLLLAFWMVNDADCAVA